MKIALKLWPIGGFGPAIRDAVVHQVNAGIENDSLKVTEEERSSYTAGREQRVWDILRTLLDDDMMKIEIDLTAAVVRIKPSA